MNLSDINKLINSELTTKIKNTNTENKELSIDVKVENHFQFQNSVNICPLYSFKKYYILRITKYENPQAICIEVHIGKT